MLVLVQNTTTASIMSQPPPTPNKPSDLLRQDAGDAGTDRYYIDFTHAVWQRLLRRIVQTSNTTARRALTEGRTANRKVYVHKSWFDKQSWDDLWSKPNKAQALLIGAFGKRASTPCATSSPAPGRGQGSSSSGTTPKPGLPFAEHMHGPNHFNSSCANCASQSYYNRCTLNRTGPPPVLSLLSSFPCAPISPYG